MILHRNYGECPSCGEQCWLDSSDGIELNRIKIKDLHRTSTDYGPGEDWIEVWKCPECGMVFEERNGYP